MILKMKGGDMNVNKILGNKRGVSAVVATVLIIMITVAAVGIIWAAIIPLIKNSIDRGQACFDAQADIGLVTDQGYTCINSTAGSSLACDASNGQCGNLSIQIKKGSNNKITLVGLEASVFVGGNSQKFRFNATNTVSSGNLTISGTLPSNNEEKVLRLTNTSIYGATRLKIAPVVTVGRTEQVCDVSDDITLSICA